MLPGMGAYAGLFSESGPPRLTFIDDFQDETNSSSSYTFSSISFGAASPSRVAIAWIAMVGGSGSISSVTILGQTATQVALASSSNFKLALYKAEIPSGTSGSLVVNLSGTQDGCIAALWKATRLNSSTAVDTYTSTSTSGTFSVSAQDDGFVIVGCAGGGSGASYTITATDFTQRLYYEPASDAEGRAGEISPTSTGTVSGTWSITSSPVNRGLVAASFR